MNVVERLTSQGSVFPVITVSLCILTANLCQAQLRVYVYILLIV